ncbi:MAG: 2-dehydropantoate 2-reductase [Thalassolituus sp.]
MKQSIAILGTGALGTLMAWHWRDQTLYLRNRSGANVLTVEHPTPTTFSAPLWQGEPLDWLVVTTKAADTLRAMKGLGTSIDQVERILLLQNGMGQQQEVSDWLNQCPTEKRHKPDLWVASSTEGAYKRANGHVVYAGQGETRCGPWRSTKTDTFPPVPPGLTADNQIHQVLKAKLAINAIINPLTGYYRCLNGELLSDPAYFRHFQKLVDEVASLYKDLNWETGFDIRERANTVAAATARNQSSTLQDVLHQRPTELPYICGYLLAQAKANGLTAPELQKLYTAMSAREAEWQIEED